MDMHFRVLAAIWFLQSVWKEVICSTLFVKALIMAPLKHVGDSSLPSPKIGDLVLNGGKTPCKLLGSQEIK